MGDDTNNVNNWNTTSSGNIYLDDSWIGQGTGSITWDGNTVTTTTIQYQIPTVEIVRQMVEEMKDRINNIETVLISLVAQIKRLEDELKERKK